MRMKFLKSSRRLQNQSGTVAEPGSSSRSDQPGAAGNSAILPVREHDGATGGTRAGQGFLRSNRSLGLVAGASLAASLLITACQQLTQTLTVDFVYVASARAAGANQYGEIDVFEINSESGLMRQIPTSPFPSEGRNPVAEAVSADYGSLFVVNQDDNTIVQFVIGTDGKLYGYNTVNTPGIYPLGIAVNKSDLFVLDTYQPLPICSTAEPCSGSLAVYPLTTATSSTPAQMGTPANNPAVNAQYWPLTLTGANASHVIVPTAVNVLASGTYVYVTAYDSSTTSPVGYIFAFSVGSNGALTAVPGSPFAAGSQPSALASDPTSAYLYATDGVRGDVMGYTVGATGTLTAMSGSPFPAGNQPVGMVVDPSYPYAYVINEQDATVTAYSVSNGALKSLGNFATGLQPVAMGIDPSTDRYLFTVNFLNNTVSDFELSPTGGTLLVTQYSPFGTDANPTSVAAIPHNGSGGGVQPQ